MVFRGEVKWCSIKITSAVIMTVCVWYGSATVPVWETGSCLLMKEGREETPKQLYPTNRSITSNL